MKGRNHIKTFPPTHGSENPIFSPQYQQTLGIFPTIRDRLATVLSQKNIGARTMDKSELPDNTDIISAKKLEIAKNRLVQKLHTLKQILSEKYGENTKPIQIIMDDCFTNVLLLDTLRTILEDDQLMNEFIEILPIDYTNASSAGISDKIKPDALLILGGSLTDTHELDPQMYNTELFNILKNAISDCPDPSINNRVIAICFGQQIMGNLLNITNPEHPTITATMPGEIEFCPSPCNVISPEVLRSIYGPALYGLTNFLKGSKGFTVPFTRTGHLNFDLLDSQQELPIIALVQNKFTGGIVGWGSKNGRTLGIQFHPEISLTNHNDTVQKELSSILPHLMDTYGLTQSQIQELISNYDTENINDTGVSFYTFAILHFVKKIIQSINLAQNEHDKEKRQDHNICYDEALRTLIRINAARTYAVLHQHKIPHDDIDTNSTNLGEQSEQMLRAVDQAGKLKIAPLDRKVNRSLEEVSKTLGIKNLVLMIYDHRKSIKGPDSEKKLYFFRDRGAGDGSLLRQLNSQMYKQDIIFYGVGDYIYLDLFGYIKNILGKAVHIEIIQLLVQKLILTIDTVSGDTLQEKIINALSEIDFSPEDKIFEASGTTDHTTMFFGDNIYTLSPHVQEWIKQNLDYIQQIKKTLQSLIQQGLYADFTGFFERINLSRFNEFNISDARLAGVDFQVAVRSTSHVDGPEYKRIIMEFIQKASKQGSIFIDNGVHRSYTNIPRIKELYDIQQMFGEQVKIQLIYDRNTNYFSGAIINTAPFLDQEVLAEHIDDDFMLVDISQAYHSTFFRFERFLRQFLISNFKDFEVFWDYNSSIIDVLQQAINLMNQGKASKIKELLLNLINKIIYDLNIKGKNYNMITQDLLDRYVSVDGQNINNIIGQEIYMPEWLNTQAKRKY